MCGNGGSHSYDTENCHTFHMFSHKVWFRRAAVQGLMNTLCMHEMPRAAIQTTKHASNRELSHSPFGSVDLESLLPAYRLKCVLARQSLPGTSEFSFGLPCGLCCIMLSFDATRPGSGKRRLRRIDAGLANALTGTAHFTQALSQFHTVATCMTICDDIGHVPAIVYSIYSHYSL